MKDGEQRSSFTGTSFEPFEGDSGASPERWTSDVGRSRSNSRALDKRCRQVTEQFQSSGEAMSAVTEHFQSFGEAMSAGHGAFPELWRGDVGRSRSISRALERRCRPVTE